MISHAPWRSPCRVGVLCVSWAAQLPWLRSRGSGRELLARTPSRAAAGPASARQAPCAASRYRRSPATRAAASERLANAVPCAVLAKPARGAAERATPAARGVTPPEIRTANAAKSRGLTAPAAPAHQASSSVARSAVRESVRRCRRRSATRASASRAVPSTRRSAARPAAPRSSCARTASAATSAAATEPAVTTRPSSAAASRAMRKARAAAARRTRKRVVASALPTRRTGRAARSRTCAPGSCRGRRAVSLQTPRGSAARPKDRCRWTRPARTTSTPAARPAKFPWAASSWSAPESRERVATPTRSAARARASRVAPQASRASAVRPAHEHLRARLSFEE